MKKILQTLCIIALFFQSAMASASPFIGVWNLSYSWDCETYFHDVVLTINGNGTVKNSQDPSGGHWSENGSEIFIDLYNTQGNTAQYNGVLMEEGYMEGNSYFSNSVGCWYAYRK